MVPDISIIVPVYNAKKYLSRCLNSILAQKYQDIELILVVDGASDGSESICEEYSKRDKRIHLIYQNNAGPSKARNVGIEKASGDYLVFVDSDDYVSASYIENLYMSAKKNNSDLVSCGYQEISRFGAYNLNDFFTGTELLKKNEFIQRIFNGLGGTLWGKIFRKKIIDKNSLRLPEDIFMCEDKIFVLEYALLSHEFSAIPDIDYFYNRMNESSITAKIDMSYLQNSFCVLERTREKFIQYGFNEKEASKILSNQILNTIKPFLVMLHGSDYKYSFMEKKLIIDKIINHPILLDYKDTLKSENFINNRMINRIKQNDVVGTLLTSLLLHYKEILKANLRKIIRGV